MSKVQPMTRIISKPLGVALVVIAVPLAAAAALVSWMFGVKEKRTATEVAAYLRDFIDGKGGNWDWDDFTSLPIANTELEDIRRRAAAIDLPATDEGSTTLRKLLAEAERLAEVEAEA